MARFVHECVGALLVRGDTLLLGRRAENRDWLPGAWDVIGGHIAAGESAEHALRRELQEELGILPASLRGLGVLHSDEGQWRLQLFAVHAWEGEPANLQACEHAELRWCTRVEAKTMLARAHAGFAAVIDDALAAMQ